MSTILCPPNLRALGWPRQQSPEADLITIQSIPEYPVLGNYKKLCADTGLAIYGGGTIDAQGELAGKILSGYRADIIDGNEISPHFFGFAIDVAVGGLAEQIKVAIASRHYFTRVGLYPDNGFVHLDLAPLAWIERYGKKPAWIKHNGVYRSFDNRAGAIAFAGELLETG